MLDLMTPLNEGTKLNASNIRLRLVLAHAELTLHRYRHQTRMQWVYIKVLWNAEVEMVESKHNNVICKQGLINTLILRHGKLYFHLIIVSNYHKDRLTQQFMLFHVASYLV